MSYLKLFLTSISILMISANVVHAGPYSNDLAKCLVESTSQRDRNALVKWMFAAASAHPVVKSIATVSQAQLDEMNKIIADLFMELLTDSCSSESKKAISYEGDAAMTVAFEVLGNVAGKELFKSPEVSKAISGMEKFIDADKLTTHFE